MPPSANPAVVMLSAVALLRSNHWTTVKVIVMKPIRLAPSDMVKKAA